MKIVKLILVLVICYFLTSYYNVFSINRGFMQDADDMKAKDLIQVEDVESVKIGDSYYVFYLTEDDSFYTKLDEDEYKIFDAATKVDEKSLLVAGAGLAAIVCVLVLIKSKKR